MSRASTSAVRRAKAFLEPSGRIRVLILTQLTSYCFLSARAIWRLLALTSTMKTSVLFSSICANPSAGVRYFHSFASPYLLHGRLGVKRVDEDGRGIHARSMGDRLAGVLGSTGQLEGLGAANCQYGPDRLGFRAYRWKLVLFLIARFLFAYDCHLVNCARHTRRTARQSMVLTRLKKGSRESYSAQGRLGSGIGLLASLGGSCTHVSHGCTLERVDRGAFAELLDDTRDAVIVRNRSKGARAIFSIV